MGIFTGQAFYSSVALSFNASGLMDNKLACDRVVTNVSGNCSVCVIQQDEQDSYS